jgi:hypothetical protein
VSAPFFDKNCLGDVLGQVPLAHLAQRRRIDQPKMPVDQRLKNGFRPGVAILAHQPHVIRRLHLLYNVGSQAKADTFLVRPSRTRRSTSSLSVSYFSDFGAASEACQATTHHFPSRRT